MKEIRIMNDWGSNLKKEEATVWFFMQQMQRLNELLRRLEKEYNLFSFWWIVVGIVVSRSLTLVPSLLLKWLFDTLGGEEIITLWAVLTWALMYYCAYIASQSCERFAVEPMFFRYACAIDNILPAVAHHKLLDLPLGYHERENTGKKISKIEKGCLRIIDILIHLRWGFLPNVLYFLVNGMILLWLDWRLAIMFLSAFPVAVYFYLKARKRYWNNWEEYEDLKEESSGIFCQSIIQVPTVQGYAQEERECDLFWEKRKRMWKVDLEVCIGTQKYFFAANSLLELMYVMAIALGAYLFLYDDIAIGTIVYILTTGSVILQQMGGTVREYMEISKKLISVERLQNLLDEENDVRNDPFPVPLPFKNAWLVFCDVYFAYSQKHDAVLNGLCMAFQPGKMFAIVGKSGEGKSTILKLLTRMMDIASGCIRFNGIDIKKFDLYAYRSLFAFVRQEVGIFDGTIRYNVAYAYPNATDEEVQEAVEAACLTEVLENQKMFPDGLETQVGERGVQLSGGQRQRVEIARAYVALKRGARFLILDEATSSLDAHTEGIVQEIINTLRRERNFTIIVCAHRLATVKDSDCIYVIENGQVNESGTHDELMKNGGLYYELVTKQDIASKKVA